MAASYSEIEYNYCIVQLIKFILLEVMMSQKAKKVFIITALSVAVFFGIAILSAIVLGWVLGSTTAADGTEEIKGGGAVSMLILGISAVITTVFAKLLSRILADKNSSKKAN